MDEVLSRCSSMPCIFSIMAALHCWLPLMLSIVALMAQTPSSSLLRTERGEEERAQLMRHARWHEETSRRNSEPISWKVEHFTFKHGKKLSIATRQTQAYSMQYAGHSQYVPHHVLTLLLYICTPLSSNTMLQAAGYFLI